MARRPAAVLGETRNLRLDLEDVRERILEAQAAVAVAKRAPPEMVEIEERIETAIAIAQTDCDQWLHVERLVAPSVTAPVGDFGLGALGKANQLGVIVWAVGADVVRARLLDAARAELQRTGTKQLSDAARASAVDAATLRIAELGRSEESLCREIERVGGRVERREQADPRWLIATDPDLEGVRA